MQNKTYLKIMLTAAAVSIFVLSGCSQVVDGYRIQTVNNGIAHFTFQYPQDWKVDKIETRVNNPVTYTHVGVSSDNATWSIFVTPPEDKYPDASASIASSLSYAEKQADYKLLERTSVLVGGTIPAVYIQYYYRGIAYDNVTWVSTYGFEVWFDYNGLIWGISRSGLSNSEDVNKRHFDHLVQTFKILN